MAEETPISGQADLERALAQTADIYEALYYMGRIGFYRVLKEIVERGVKRRTAALQKLRTVARLHEEGVIALRLDYYLHMMRLNMSIVYIPKNIDCEKLPRIVPFLRSCVNVIPVGTMLTFYFPKRLEPRELGEGRARHYVFYERLFNRTDVGRYAAGLAADPTSFFSQEKLEGHFAEELKKGRSEESLSDLEAEVFGARVRTRMDNKDLTILKSVELNPLTTVSLHAKLGIKESLLRKHLEHTESLLRGIRIRRFDGISRASRVGLLITIRGKSGEVLRFMSAALRYPTVTSSSVSKDLRSFLLQLLFPGNIDVIKSAATRLRNIAWERGLEVVDHYLVDLSTLANYTVPFVRELEYSPLSRDWLEESVREALRYLKSA